MPLLRTKNPLVFPGSRPGFDPSHPAAYRPLFSTTAGRGNFTNIFTGGKGTITNGTGAPAAVMDGRIGPAINFPTSGGTGFITFPAIGGTITKATFAAIVVPTAVGSNQVFFDSSSTNNGLSIGLNTSSQFALTLDGVSAVASAKALVVGVPYFVAASFNGTTTNLCLARLDTGQIYTSSGAQTGSPVSTGLLVIGNGQGNAREAISNIAAVMYSFSYLSLPQLRAWSADPWSFWYPRTVENLIMSSLRGPAAASTIVQRRTASLIGTRTGSRQMII